MSFERGARLGKYEIGQKLAAGGFGILYAARDTELQRDVAIKLLRPEHAFREQVVQRFLQEARAAARINHPGIVTVFESGQVTGTNSRNDGSVYIAMELLAGDTLAARIKAAKRLPAQIAIGYCRQMADALAAAHLANIVHRDLKPHNVIIVRDQAVVGGERLKVLDFGIAKLADGMGGNLQTHSMVMLGTPMYMSPEQCKSSAKVDTRSDIYSLGCMLFEMLAGSPPFDGDAGELIAKHQLVPPPRVRDLVPAVPPELDKLVAAMLAKSPDDRPQSMTALIDALDTLLGHSVHERPTTPFARPPVVFERTTVEAPLVPLTTGATPVMRPVLPPPGEPSTVDGFGLGQSESPPPPPPPPARRFFQRIPLPVAALFAIGIGVVGGLVAVGGKSRSSPSPEKHVAYSALLDARPADPAAESDASSEVANVEADAAVVEADAAVADEAPTFDIDRLAQECQKYVSDRDWDACIQCGEKLPDTTKAAEVKETCTNERDNAEAFVALKQAFVARKHDLAHSLLDKIEPTSVYRREGELLVDVMPPPPTAGTPGKTHKARTTPGCDAEEARDQGMVLINKGNHASALVQLEASLKCQDDPYVRQLAFMEACSSRNPAKARLYYGKITPDQQKKFGVICELQKPPVEYRDPPCKADELRDQGMTLINSGQHAAALTKFEAALKCSDDPYTRQLAFMEACASGNSSKAKRYYKMLSAMQQAKFAQICIRQSPPVAYE